MDAVLELFDKYNSLIVLVIVPLFHYLRNFYNSHQAVIAELQESNRLTREELSAVREELNELKKIVLGIYTTPDIMEEVQALLTKRHAFDSRKT